MNLTSISVDQIKLAFQEALIGEIYPAIKAIAFNYEHKKLTTRIYLDRELSDVDYNNISAIVTEVIAQFSHVNFNSVKEECIYSDEPLSSLNESIRTLVYARKE